MLSSLEIVRQKLAPRVAVLATCRSQVDDDPATSLVAAFLAAGAAGVVGVKRALDDADSANLMTEFYRASGADNPMLALATAQRAAISNHALPHAWATVSFFGVGGWMNRSD
jgi:CHAT domain-containing protein